MNAASYLDIARMPVVRRFEDAFRSAMGVPVKLFSADIPTRRLSLGFSENAFCLLVASTSKGCECCVSAQACAQRGAAQHFRAKQVSCAAGLTEVAVPVIVGGRHVATLLTGQVMRREPTDRDFDLVARLLEQAPIDEAWRKSLKAAYFATPVLTVVRLNSMVRMLGLFASFLSDSVGTESVGCMEEEPLAVARAKRFVQEHMSGAVDLESVIRHVSVSRFYFCRLFKKATGMTLSEYVSRVRLEKAKTLLLDPALRIAEIGYATGFRSVPRFNRVFKHHVGMSPSAYRMSIEARLPVATIKAFPG